MSKFESKRKLVRDYIKFQMDYHKEKCQEHTKKYNKYLKVLSELPYTSKYDNLLEELGQTK